jgi:hypothetical protein
MKRLKDNDPAMRAEYNRIAARWHRPSWADFLEHTDVRAAARRAALRDGADFEATGRTRRLEPKR